MSFLERAPLADFIAPLHRDTCRDCLFTGAERIARETHFVGPPRPDQRAAYHIEIPDPAFTGKLHMLLGHGRGDVRILSGGPITASFRLWRRVSLTIGARTTISQARIICDDADIEIGKDGLWSDEIIVQSNDQHGIIDLATGAPFRTGRRHIRVGPHVWLGRRAMLMPDVEIGREAIIAAGAVVTGDVAPNCIYAGVPASCIRENISWSRRPDGFSDFERRFLGHDLPPDHAADHWADHAADPTPADAGEPAPEPAPETEPEPGPETEPEPETNPRTGREKPGESG